MEPLEQLETAARNGLNVIKLSRQQLADLPRMSQFFEIEERVAQPFDPGARENPGRE